MRLHLDRGRIFRRTMQPHAATGVAKLTSQTLQHLPAIDPTETPFAVIRQVVANCKTLGADREMLHAVAVILRRTPEPMLARNGARLVVMVFESLCDSQGGAK